MAVDWLDQPGDHDYGAAADYLSIADGYHRVCATYLTDENTLVSWQT